jgi:hypothetical protein
LLASGGDRCPLNHVGLEIVAGSLPDGLRLTSSGYFSGVPTGIGRHDFRLRATNGCGRIEQEFTLEVTAAPVLRVTPRSRLIEYKMQSSFNPPIYIRIDADRPGQAYAVYAPQYPWIRLVPRSGRVPANEGGLEGDLVEVQLDHANLWPGDYSIPIRVAAWQASNQPEAVLSLRVRQPELELVRLPLDNRAPKLPVPGVPPVPVRIYVPPPPPPAITPQAPSRLSRSRFRQFTAPTQAVPPASNATGAVAATPSHR